MDNHTRKELKLMANKLREVANLMERGLCKSWRISLSEGHVEINVEYTDPVLYIQSLQNQAKYFNTLGDHLK
jgi:hypothetical protein